MSAEAAKYGVLMRFLPRNDKVRAWVQASRLIGQLQLHLPMWLAQGLAYALTGTFSVGACVWLTLFGIFDGLFISYANDVADAETDARNSTFQLFSGGSRVIVEGKLTRKALAIGALLMLGAMVALCFDAQSQRPLVWGFFAAAFFLMHAYSFAPLKLSYRGHGEALQMLGCGVVLPLLAWYIQTGDLERFPWLTLGPFALFAYAGNILSALPDVPSDAECHKRTYPVRRGELPARREAFAMILAGVIMGTVLAYQEGLPLLAVALVVMPASLVMVIAWKLIPRADAMNRTEVRRYVMALATAINCVFCWWLSGLVFSKGMGLL